MKYNSENHTFAICAYKSSPYLEECIQSIKSQKILGKIVLATSTPNDYIENLALKYDIQYFVRKGASNIADDWNFAYSCAGTELVTIAHQDDIYCEGYLSEALSEINKSDKPLIFFSDYGEIRDGITVTNNTLLKIKKLLLFPLRNKVFWKSRYIRRRVLSMGSPICCPSVMFAKDNLSGFEFKKGYHGALDWQAWEEISRKKGSFVYSHNVLMLHRIHEESETTHIIADSNRTKEDYEMFCKFWPNWMAKILMKAYSKSQNSNSL